jgi:hypothetical protein
MLGRGFNIDRVIVESTSDEDVIILTVAPFSHKFRVTEHDLMGLPRKSVVLHNPRSNADEK